MVNRKVMVDFIETASSALKLSNKQLEIVSNNILNLSTSGYKRTEAFIQSQMMEQLNFQEQLDRPNLYAMKLSFKLDDSQGPISNSGNDLDLALGTEGYFVLRADETIVYSRSGQFSLDPEGRVVDAQGFALQDTRGSDIVLISSDISVLSDGLILEDGLPQSKIAVVGPDGSSAIEALSGSYISAPERSMVPTQNPMVRQGLIEGSNVVLADEMLIMMEAMRSAETSSRLVRTYDNLIGQAISTFNRGGA